MRKLLNGAIVSPLSFPGPHPNSIIRIPSGSAIRSYNHACQPRVARPYLSCGAILPIMASGPAHGPRAKSYSDPSILSLIPHEVFGAIRPPAVQDRAAKASASAETRGGRRLQPTACRTSALILASTTAVNSVSAKAVGHMAPRSRFAASLKPSVAYRALNFWPLWKKQTTLPSLA
jgi:hypothetical protein